MTEERRCAVLGQVKTLLKELQSRDDFFAMIGLFLPTMDPRYQSIKKAYDETKDAFRNNLRVGGERYFEHLRGVATIQVAYLRIRDPDIIIAGLLHDIVEDIPFWTIERVRLAFGDRVALYVDWATKPPLEDFPSREERDRAFFSRFLLAPREFWLIKLPDRLHNLLTMWVYSAEKIAQKIEETRRYYIPYAEQHLILLHEMEAALAELEDSIRNPDSAC